MRYWDTSAIVGMLVDEPASAGIRAEHERDPEMTTWWGTQVECVSALARLEREGRLDRAEVGAAFQRLDALAAAWVEVQPSERIRVTAGRLLRVHVLRAADALQLAAVTAAAEGDPRSLPMVTRDTRMMVAAEREGFKVITPA